jgi:uncharacterized protein (DUF952 family)
VIYKLLRPGEWDELRRLGRFAGSPVDRKDGFIHFSSAAQARETAARHFDGVADLVLAEVDPARLDPPPVWEPSRGGALFPHLYAALPLAAVTRTWTLSLGPDGRHSFPIELP